MLGRQKAIRLAAIIAVLVGTLAAMLAVAGSRYIRNRRLYLTGAVIKQSDDPLKESPITDLEISVADGLAVGSAKSNFAGFFSIRLVRGIGRKQSVTLRFGHPDYHPLDRTQLAGDGLCIVHLVPIHNEAEVKPD